MESLLLNCSNPSPNPSRIPRVGSVVAACEVMKEIERIMGSERLECADVPLPIDIEAAYLDRNSYASVKQHELELLLYSLKEDVELIKRRNAAKVRASSTFILTILRKIP